LGVKYCKHCEKDFDSNDKTHWYIYKTSSLCKTYYNNKLKKWRHSGNPLYKKQTYTLKANYRSLKGSAKSRGILVQISFDYYSKLRDNKDCSYCGDLIGETTGCSIDRVDSSLGYIEGNCVVCCSLCNKMKGTLDLETFIRQITRILRKGNY